jgi:hypothetical protein
MTPTQKAALTPRQAAAITAVGTEAAGKIAGIIESGANAGTNQRDPRDD